MPIDLSVDVGPIHLSSPLVAASGTFGYGEEYGEIYDLAVIGAVVSKSVTVSPRAGNAPPRIVETACGMLNSIGLANAGLDHFLTEELPAMCKLGTQVIVNLAGKTVEDFQQLASAVGGEEGVTALELNVSCPNVKEGGMAFGVDPVATREVVAACRELTKLPLITKLSPNVTRITDIAQAAVDGGTDVLSLVNTLMGMAIDWRRRRPVLGAITGGLSGPAIKPVALRMVYEVAGLGIAPVIGIGGIMSADDVLEFLVAGASAVQFGTATFADPLAGKRIAQELNETLSARGIATVAEVIGTIERK